jgi:hypothetical protein
VDREHFKEVREIFEAALQITPPERQAYIDKACGGDAALLNDVSDLLKAHGDLNPLLRTGAVPIPALVRDLLLEPGCVLGGRFEIVRLLGRGGMGQVYEANDRLLRRTVALKLLPTEQADDPHFRQRLHREARALAALKHPNICAVHDVGRYDGQDVLVIEYLEGETLAARVRRTGRISLTEMVQIAVDICKALQYAHSRGVIHRDLKPANIMLTSEGVKLLDFGIARFVASDPVDIRHAPMPRTGDAHVTATLTGHAGVVGTLQYMSPEQASGEPLDGRSDLFSLGVFLYEMTTGTTPFAGDSPSEVVHAILHVPPALPRMFNREIPLALQDAICKCLEKSRHLRFNSAAELEQALQAVQSDPAFSSGDPERVPYTLANRTTKLWAVAAAVSLLVAVPLYRLFDIRAAITLGVGRAGATRAAQKWAADLAFPTEGLREHVVFNPVVDLHGVGTVAGVEGMRRIVESGKAFAWDIDFTPDGSQRSAPARDAGVSVRLDCAGGLLEFQRAGIPLRTPRDVRQILSHSYGVLASYFRLIPRREASVGNESFSWALPIGVKGWEEQIRVQWSDDTDLTGDGGRPKHLGHLLLLSRGIVSQPGVLPIGGQISPPAIAVWNIQAVLGRHLLTVPYLFGIWMLFRYRHSLRWLPALTLTAFLAVFAMYASYVNVDSSAPPHMSKGLSSVSLGITTFALLTPAVAGVYAWLRGKHYAAVIGLEQLLQGKWSARAAGASLADGVLAGLVIAGVEILQGTVSSSLLHLPDITGLVTGIGADSPWLITEAGLSFAAPAIVLGLVATFHATSRLIQIGAQIRQGTGTRTDLAAIVTTSAVVGFLTADLSSPRFVTDPAFGALALACCLVVYRTAGLAAAVVANLTTGFVVAGIIGVHLGNASFAQRSMTLLEIPAVLVLTAIVAGVVGPKVAKPRILAR